MTTRFDSFDESDLGDFRQSPFGERNLSPDVVPPLRRRIVFMMMVNNSQGYLTSDGFEEFNLDLFEYRNKLVELQNIGWSVSAGVFQVRNGSEDVFPGTLSSTGRIFPASDVRIRVLGTDVSDSNVLQQWLDYFGFLADWQLAFPDGKAGVLVHQTQDRDRLYEPGMSAFLQTVVPRNLVQLVLDFGSVGFPEENATGKWLRVLNTSLQRLIDFPPRGE